MVDFDPVEDYGVDVAFDEVGQLDILPGPEAYTTVR